METTNPSELRKFGFILAGGLVVIFGLLFPWLSDHAIPGWPFAAGAVFALLGLVSPRALGPIYRIWMKLGHVMGWINTRIILSIVFFALFFPVSIVLRLMGKDPMARKLEPSASTYRIESHQPEPKHLEKPF